MYRCVYNNQSNGIYNNYSQGFMAVVNKSLPLAMPSDSSVYCHTSLALCYNYYINDHCGFIGFVSISGSLTKHFLVTFPCAGSDSLVQANLRSHSEYVGDLLEVGALVYSEFLVGRPIHLQGTSCRGWVLETVLKSSPG